MEKQKYQYRLVELLDGGEYDIIGYRPNYESARLLQSMHGPSAILQRRPVGEWEDMSIDTSNEAVAVPKSYAATQAVSEAGPVEVAPARDKPPVPGKP